MSVLFVGTRTLDIPNVTFFDVSLHLGRRIYLQTAEVHFGWPSVFWAGRHLLHLVAEGSRVLFLSPFTLTLLPTLRPLNGPPPYHHKHLLSTGTFRDCRDPYPNLFQILSSFCRMYICFRPKRRDPATFSYLHPVALVAPRALVLPLRRAVQTFLPS